MSVEPLDHNKAVVRRMIDEGWNQGKLEVVDEIVDAAYVGRDPSMPAPIQGPAGFRQYIAGARSAFPDFHITLDELFAEGQKVAGRITMRGTHAGPLMGLPPTGKPVTFTGIFVRRIVDSKFVEGWDQADMLSLLQQIGVIPSAS